MSLKPTSALFTASTKERNLTPIKDLAKASAACSEVGKLYATCVIRAQFDENSTGIERGICQKEFQAFKECVQTTVKRKW